MPVITKVFEFAVLECILPVLSDARHPLLTQTTYRRHVSCQDASQEDLLALMKDGGHALLLL